MNLKISVQDTLKTQITIAKEIKDFNTFATANTTIFHSYRLGSHICNA